MADVAALLDHFRKGVWLPNRAGKLTWVGEGVSADYDGYYGAQCMDLTLFWSEYLGLPLIEASAAVYTWTVSPKGYTKIPNVGGLPVPGDIAVFGTQVGPSGHISIVIEAGPSGFTSLDQNWYNSNETVGSPAALVAHNYSAVMGWFRPLLAPAHERLSVDEEQQQTEVL